MKTPDYGWLEPSAYSHRTGVVKQKKRPIVRYVLIIGLIINGAVFGASTQLGKQFDTVVNTDTGPVQAAKVQEIPLPQLAAVTPNAPESASFADPELQAILQKWSNAHQKQDWSIVVQGLGDDNRYASIRGDSWYVPASLYKLLLMYPLFQKYDVKDLEHQSITIDKATRNLKTCVEQMLMYSDNPCGEALGKNIGWYRADSALQKAGLKQTQLNRKDAMFANASDMSKFLKGLYDSTLFSAEERDFILKNMQLGSWRKGIPSICSDCSVANKTGDLSNVRHDVAIVSYPGGAYSLSIMTSGASYKDIAEISKQIHQHIVSTIP
jgi:beta-lactamase class A